MNVFIFRTASIGVLSLLALGVSVSSAFAHTDLGDVNVSATVTPPLKSGLFHDLRHAEREEASTAHANIVDAHTQFRANVHASSTALRADIQAELAAATTSDAKRAILEAVKGERQNFRAGIEEERQNMQEGFQEERAQLRSERIRIAMEHLNLMIARLAMALDTFIQIDTRIDTRIAKLQGTGLDVRAAMNASHAVKTSIINAQSVIANASSTVTVAINANTPANHLADVRTAIQKANDALKHVHDALKDAVAALKAISKPNPNSSDNAVEHATSTGN